MSLSLRFDRALVLASDLHRHQVSDDALLVSLADKLHNVRAILRDLRAEGESVWGRFNAPRADILWYYRALVEEFRKAGSSSLLLQFEAAVTELEAAAA